MNLNKKNLIITLIKYLLFWVFYFVLARLVFLVSNFNMLSDATGEEVAKTFFYGIKMDLSMAGYLSLIPGIHFAFSPFIPAKINFRVLQVYTLLLLVATTFLNVLDIGLYPHWGTRIGISAFNYAGDPKAALSNVTLKEGVMAALVFTFYLVLFGWIFSKLFSAAFNDKPNYKWLMVPLMLFLTSCLLVPIRGGLGTSPINHSTVSFSNKLFMNHAALNYLWNFGNTIERRNTLINPCDYLPAEDARQHFDDVEGGLTSSDSIYIQPGEANQPNVILVILESISSKAISSLGGNYGVCPNLDSLAQQGIVFPNFYAAGNRSDRGISAILGSYPSLMDLSIMRFPDKSDKLTSLSEYFNRQHYHTSFYYGGDIDFYNLKSFILQGNYKNITALKQFPKEIQYECAWGVHDERVFNRALSDLQKREGPFFSVLYTVSSHTPFDVPAQIIPGNSTEAKFLNSIAYTDRCIGEFIKGLKKSGQWDNTLVIITSDHGALDPGPTDATDPETYRIPLIWTGGIVKNPAVIDHLGGQIDIAPTLLTQLGWERDPALFGHDLFTGPSYAFYMLDLGWGYVEKEGECFYDQAAGKMIRHKKYNGQDVNIDFAKSYLQLLYEDFLAI